MVEKLGLARKKKGGESDGGRRGLYNVGDGKESAVLEAERDARAS